MFRDSIVPRYRPSAGYPGEAEIDTLAVIRSFVVSPDRILQAWIEPSMACRWLFTSRSPRAEFAFDASPENAYTITQRTGGKRYVTRVEYQVAAQPCRLHFTYSRDHRPKQRHALEALLEPHGPGCLLTLIQDCLSPVQDRYLVRRWEAKLDALNSFLKYGA